MRVRGSPRCGTARAGPHAPSRLEIVARRDASAIAGHALRRRGRAERAAASRPDPASASSAHAAMIELAVSRARSRRSAPASMLLVVERRVLPECRPVLGFVADADFD